MEHGVAIGAGSRPQTRRRVERGRRSRNGCLTCIGKKVKCDEQHPACGRCIRLKLPCEWPPSKPPLASRRRGLGPIKYRHCWRPQEILSRAREGDEQCVIASSADLQDESVAPRDTIAAGASSPVKGLEDQDSTSFALSSAESTAAENDPSLLWAAVGPWRSNPVAGDATTLHIHQNMLFPSPQLTFFPSLSTDFLSMATALSFTHPLDPAPSIGCDDSQAVTFHRTILAPLKSTRVAALSAHGLFLDLAAHNRMALHFLLAFSYSELAIHQGFSHHPPVESYRHFQQGSWLFDQALGSSNHVAMMLSFLYLYMFWMRRDPLDVAKLGELSTFILVYVKSLGLDDLCAGPGVEDSKPVLLSRVLTYIYDRDVFCGFFGNGQAFAGFVSENNDKRSRIWQLSRSSFPSWDDHDTGSSQGSRSQHSMVLDIYFILITIQHEINCYSQGGDAQTPGLELGIRRKLDRIREEHSFLFDLVANRAAPLMALVAATFFHALEIYLCRSRDSDLGQVPTPARVQVSLNKLVTTAYYAIAAGPVQLLERLQWALLIAGIETQDPVHRDWISANISDPAIKGIYQAIQAAKGPSGVSMRAIRELVGRRGL